MTAAFSDAEKQLLGTLQEELLQLKHRYGKQLSLKKATSPATAPFPIQIAVRLESPATASNFDVSSLRVLLTLARTFLSGRGDGLAVRTYSDELPASLCDAIGTKLQHVWAEQVARDAGAGLQALLGYVQEHYLELLMLLPAMLEAYEAVNSAGATARRYAFVDASPPQEQEQEQQAPGSTPSSTTPQTPPHASRPPPAPPAPQPSTLPPHPAATQHAPPSDKPDPTPQPTPVAPPATTSTPAAAPAAAATTTTTPPAGRRQPQSDTPPPVACSTAPCTQPPASPPAPTRPASAAPASTSTSTPAGLRPDAAAFVPAAANTTSAPQPAPHSTPGRAAPAARPSTSKPPAASGKRPQQGSARGNAAAAAHAAAAAAASRALNPPTASTSGHPPALAPRTRRTITGPSTTETSETTGVHTGPPDPPPTGSRRQPAPGRGNRTPASNPAVATTPPTAAPQAAPPNPLSRRARQRQAPPRGPPTSDTATTTSAPTAAPPQPRPPRQRPARNRRQPALLDWLPTPSSTPTPTSTASTPAAPTPATPPAATPPPPPSAAAVELAYLQRRYPGACTLHPPAPSGAASFALTLHPTDPAWPPRTPLPLQGQLQAAFPAPGALFLQVPASSGLPRDTQVALNGRLRERAAALGGSPTALRALVKLLENYAAHLSQQRPPPAAREPGVSAATLTAAVTDAATAADTADAAAGTGAAAAAPSVDRAGRKQRQQQQQQVDGGNEGAGREPAVDSGGSGSGGSSSSWYSGSEDESDARSSDSGGSEAGGEERAGTSAVEGGRCYRVVLQGCALEGADALDAIRLSLQVACGRCGEPQVAVLASRVVLDSLPPGARPFQHLAACPRCTNPWAASLRPEFVHSTSSTLGLLRTSGCAPRDLLPSVLGLQCTHCYETSTLRNVQLGAPATRRCGACHEPLSLRIDAAAFVPAGPPSAPARSRRGPSRAETGSGNDGAGGGAGGASGLAGPHAQLTVGQPLPGLGTCAHYRHSHRWLRFPCCGMRFPCDLCHEEATDGHAMRWAVRMACGYCSLEQPLGEACTGCGKKLAGSGRRPQGRSTRFWEGGEGCRDKRAMDSRDAHKWRGSKAKTRSAKHKRVGPKAVPKDKAKAP